MAKLGVGLPGVSLGEKGLSQLPRLLGPSPEDEVCGCPHAFPQGLRGRVGSTALALAETAAACFGGRTEGGMKLLFQTEGLCILVKKMHNIKIS